MLLNDNKITICTRPCARFFRTESSGGKPARPLNVFIHDIISYYHIIIYDFRGPARRHGR